MASKQILFRLDTITATALEKKLTEKGISKQFLFSKVVDLFIDDKLSFDNNVIATNNDNKKITIDSSKVAETIKKHYLEDIAKIIANDSNLIALVTEKLESNVQAELEGNDNKSYQSDQSSNDSKVITFDREKPKVSNLNTNQEDNLYSVKNSDSKPINNTDNLSDSDTDKEDKSIPETLETKSTNTPEKGNEAESDDSEEALTFEDSRVKIKEWHSQSKEMKDIIKELNEGSYPTKTGSVGKWRSNQVKSILKNFSQNKT